MDTKQQRFLDGLERVQERRARPQQGDNYVGSLTLQQQQDPISLAGAAVVGLLEIGVPLGLAQFGGFLVTTAATIAVGFNSTAASRRLS